MLTELKAMSDSICNNYEKNMGNREKNPFLPLVNKNIKKYMALGRSIDSQLGNRIQRIIFFLSRQKFGVLGVPNITVLNYDERTARVSVTLYSVPIDVEEKWQNKNFNPFAQYVYIDSNLSDKEAKRKLKLKSICNKLATTNIEMDVNSPAAKSELLKWKRKNYPVDLLTLSLKEEGTSEKTIIDGLFVYEIKMGGNLDTKNAPSNADEVLKNKNMFSFVANSHSYFATCYGECSTSVKNAMELRKCELLTPDDFWTKVLPVDITFKDFIDKYKVAFKKSKIENAIEKLKSS